MTGAGALKHDHILSVLAKVTITKPRSYRVEGLRQVLKPKNVTE